MKRTRKSAGRQISHHLRSLHERLEPRVMLAADVIINEIMYHAMNPATPGQAAIGEEYIELYNKGPVSLDLTAGANGFGLISFDYGYAGYADGHGRFDYAFPDPKSGCTIEVTTYFNKQGAGRDTFRVRCGPFVFGPVEQCWDVSACLVYANDPLAFTPACNGIKPCLLGSVTACQL